MYNSGPTHEIVESKDASRGTRSHNLLIDGIRKAYAKWEKALTSDEEFRSELSCLGLVLTSEFHHLVSRYGPSRMMPWRKLIKALQVESGEQLHVPREQMYGSRIRGFVAPTDQVAGGYPSSSGGGSDPAELKASIIEFIQGHIPSASFRRNLRRLNLPVTSDIEYLLRLHEAERCVTFQELASEVLKAERQSRRGNDDGSYASYPSTSSMSRSKSSSAVSGGGRRDATPKRHQYEEKPTAGKEQTEELYCVPPARGKVYEIGDRMKMGHGNVIAWPGGAPQEVRRAKTPPPVLQGSRPGFLQWPTPRQDEQDDNLRVQRRARTPPASRQQDNLLSWPVDTFCDYHEELHHKQGRRFFETPPTQPYGRSSDRDPHSHGPLGLSPPYGSEADLRRRRSYDTGTREIRPGIRKEERVPVPRVERGAPEWQK